MQGIGAALLLPNSLALLNAAFEGEKRGRAVGIWAAAGAAAAAVAPLIGGWLVDTVGWPAIFYINLPLAARRDPAGAAVRRRKPRRRRRAHRLCRRAARHRWARRRDLRADALVVVAAASTPLAGASIAAGLALLAAFLRVEKRRGDKAMMPLAIFTGRCFFGLNLMTFLLYGAFGAAMLLIPYVLIDGGRLFAGPGGHGDAAAADPARASARR